MTFASGIRDFLAALYELLQNSQMRRWYVGQLFYAFFVGSLLLAAIFFGSFFFLDFLIEGFAALLVGFNLDWLATIANWLVQGSEIASGILSILLLILLAGPLMLIGATFFLGQFGRWQKLKGIVAPHQKLEEPPFSIKELLKEVIVSIYLLTLVVLALLLGLLGPLAIFGFLVSAYAVGREWVQTGDGQIVAQKRKATPAVYSLGLGLIPTAFAFIPIVGVLSIPLLQYASLKRYRKL